MIVTILTLKIVNGIGKLFQRTENTRTGRITERLLNDRMEPEELTVICEGKPQGPYRELPDEGIHNQEYAQYAHHARNIGL